MWGMYSPFGTFHFSRLQSLLIDIMERALLFKYLITLAVLTTFLTGCFGDNPEESNAQHLQRAQAYQEQGQYKAAMIEYRNAVKKSGGGLESIVKYADMLNELGRNASALDLLNQASGEKNDRYYYELVESFIALKKYQSAEEALGNVDRDASPEAMLLNAQIAAGNGDLKKSEALFRQVAASQEQTNELKSKAHLGLAMSMARQTRFDAAQKELAQIPVADANYPDAQVIKAGIEIVRDDLSAAEATLSDVLSRMRNTDIMEPEKAVVLERLSYVLTRLGRSNEAYVYQKLLAEAFPGANEVSESYQAAVEAFQNKDYAKAKAALQSILEDYPTHNKAKQLLGVISYLEGDTQQASRYLSESVDPEVVDPLTRHVYAATNLKLQDPKKVLEILGPKVDTTDSAKTLALYAVAAISDGQGKKGEEALLRAAELEPENVRIRLTLANYYNNRRPPQSDAAYKHLEKSYAVAPTDQQVLTELVAHHFRQSGLEKAESFVQTALKNHPDAYGANLVAGYVSVAAQKLDSALGYFSSAVAAKSQVSDYSESLFAKGRTEFSLGRYQDAEKSLLVLIKDYPEFEQAYKALYAVYSKLENSEFAAEKLENLAKRNAVIQPYLVLIEANLARGNTVQSEIYYKEAKSLSRNSEALSDVDRNIRYAKALQALRQGDMKEARGLIAGLLTETPDNIRLLSFLVDVEIRDGNYQEAGKVLEQLKALDSEHPVIPVLHGDIEVAQQKLENARTYYEQAWNQTPSNLVADKLLAVLSMLKDDSARRDLLQSWQEKIPSAAKPILLQAITYQERGQKTRATESYQMVLERQPDNVAALNNLGWIYFEEGVFSKSLELLNRAADLSPENPAVLDSLGWVLFKNDQRDKALPYLEKANQLAPGNEEISAHLETVRKAG
ncbi:MAG: hypothetical protein C9356_01945 [Oleiphilus sp.]|nr:MAG: hypothetical protein C9356_01945 [Oleiphilus sp.]